MKKKVKIEDVEFALTKNQIDANKAKQVIDDLAAALNVEEEPKEVKNPKEYVILISDPNGIINTNLVGWPIQIEEGEDPATIIDKISTAAAQFNNTKKGKKAPLDSIGEAIEVGGKFFKENSVWSKTKVPVRVIATNNQLIKY